MTNIIGTFAAVKSDYFHAAVAGLACFEIAARKAKGPGTFKEQMFDALYHLDKMTIDQMTRIETGAGGRFLN